MKTIINSVPIFFSLLIYINFLNASIRELNIEEMSFSNVKDFDALFHFVEHDTCLTLTNSLSEGTDVSLKMLEIQFNNLTMNAGLSQCGILTYANRELHYEIIDSNEACTIVKLTYEGKFLYRVIAWLSTALLPDAVYEICMWSVGDKKICDAVYVVTEVLIELNSGTRSGSTKGINWTASKTASKSTATINTSSYDIATGAKAAFAAYRDECSSGGSVPWESISVNGNSQKTKIYNSKSKKVHIDYSESGSSWTCLDFDAYDSYTFASNVKYVRVFTGDKDYESYKISPGTSYKIVWSSEHGQNELRE